MIQAIAIDGPAASGKTVVGQQLAARLEWDFLDTGIMYRALTWLALERGLSPDDAHALGRLAADHPITLPANGASPARPVAIAGHPLGPELHQPRIANHVSPVSRHSPVRRALVRRQRQIAAQSAAARGGIVMTGRDIGTVVLPDAGLKVYLTAPPEQRARRRWQETQERGQNTPLETVIQETKSRDAIDSSRADSPLRPAPDAWILDTGNLSIEQAVDAIFRRAQGD